jgi:hypothetical protein
LFGWRPKPPDQGRREPKGNEKHLPLRQGRRGGRENRSTIENLKELQQLSCLVLSGAHLD